MHKICFFAGHDNTPDILFLDLMTEVRWHIEVYGVTECQWLPHNGQQPDGD